MFKKLLISTSLLLSLAASAATVEVKQGWNLIGVKSQTLSSSIIENENEYIHYYKNGSWEYFTTTKTGTIDPGMAFWYKSTTTKNLDIGTQNTTDKTLSNPWELVTPTNSTWDLNQKQNIAYAWKFTGGENGKWQLYHSNPSYTQTKYETFTQVNQGQGVWLKISNAMIGNTPVYIKNGDFGTVEKQATTITTKPQLYSTVENLYNFTININPGTINTSNYGITMSLQKDNGSKYLFSIAKVSNTTAVSIQKSDGTASVTTYNISNPADFLENNTKLRLNFQNVLEYFIPSYFTFEDAKAKLTAKATYTYEIESSSVDIENSKNNKVTGKLIIK